MNEMINNRNGPDSRSERIDLFSILLESHQKGELKEDELLGNMFMFLIAGHEVIESLLHSSA
jgi:cytochrome P450